MKLEQSTIKDIARELNVSSSTVSRALKDYPGISDETKRKVKEMADKLKSLSALIYTDEPPVVMGPDQLFAPLIERSAPVPVAVAPLNDSDSPLTVIPPSKTKLVPEFTVIKPPATPSALLCWRTNVPAETVIVPAKVLSPCKVTVPAPLFTTFPVPEIRPEYV